MNVLIDGNIILDVLQNRKPHAEASSKVWKLCETNLVEGYVSALTFADMVYVMRKELTPEMIQEVLGKMSLIFHFTELSISDMEKAAGMMWKDYEDAVQAATAERIRATAAFALQPLLPEISKIISKARSLLSHQRSSWNGSDRFVFRFAAK